MARKWIWGLTTLLATLVAAYAFTSIAAPGLRTPFVADLVAVKALRTFVHLAGGGVAIVAGVFQFSSALRFRSPRVHRLLGRIYVVAVLIGGVAGGLLAPWSAGGITGHFGFGLLAVLWVGTTVAAWRSAVARKYPAHRVWMIRSYALCLAAVTLRVYVPLSAVLGVPFESAYPAIAWLCWVPNLIVAEWLVAPGPFAPLEPASP